MNIVRDPIYGQNPALLEAFRSDAAQQETAYGFHCIDFGLDGFSWNAVTRP